MFRNISAILLLAAFAMQTFERTFWVLDYLGNSASFAKNCENKYRPQMHCNGQCVLMKKLKEQETKEQQAPERKSAGKSEVISSASFCDLRDVPSIQQPIHFHSFSNASLLKMPRSIFHPPNA
jgi:hypothetical protein